MPETALQLLITCEHGGNTIPAQYRWAFKDAASALNSHRGYDPGALELARYLARRLHSPLVVETRSRLLIELNRTLGHPRIFSEFSRRLSLEDQERLVEEIYCPYRQKVIDQITAFQKQDRVLHLSIHSFTPVMHEKTRRTDLGLLFDPAREFEMRIATAWKPALRRHLPEQATHFNLPYRGTSDGFTTALRKQFSDVKYAGIELEVNQKIVAAGGEDWKNTQRGIAAALREVLKP